MNAKQSLFAAALTLAGCLATFVPALAACTISTTAVSFGNYNVFSPSSLDSTGNITYRCGPKDRNITIFLDRGGAPSFSPRRMLKVTEALNYNLYLDAGRTTIWGDGTGGTQFYSDRNPPNNRNVTVTIYGRVPAGQDISAGAYANTITATVNF